jgi:elongation factor G
MAQRTPSSICNVAIVGHGGVGKTTFVDHVLHTVGVANRAGDVDAGTSLSDYDADERERQFSINSAIFHFEANDRYFNLIDTPGYLDFAGAAVGVLPAVETAVIAVSARDGVQLNTRRMWRAAGAAALARVVLITRADSENIDFGRLMADIHESLGPECRPASLPIGLGAPCSGVVDLLEPGEAPEGTVGDFEAARQAFHESIIESDDMLMERYLEGGEVSPAELGAALRPAVAAGTVVPVLWAAAKANVGVREAIRFLARCCPSPAEGARRTATDGEGAEVVLEPSLEGPFCAKVFRTTTDLHVGKIVCFRLYSGKLPGDLVVQLARTGRNMRLGHVFALQGQHQEEVSEGVAGDILAVTKVEDLELNDTLLDGKQALVLPPTEFPNPMMSLAVEPQSREDEEKITAGLRDLAQGDPTFTVRRDRNTGELVATGMSSLHLDVMLAKLRRRHDISVTTREPAVPYLETVTRTAEGHHRHKKQTGGRGQYGEVYLRVEPNERGAGFEFIDEVVGGAIPRQFIPAVEKGVREQMEHGPLSGCPVVDVKAAVHYGTFHSVDSSEASFKLAGGRAFVDAFQNARPVLLEPIALMEVTIPAEFVGDVAGNLAGHRARILGMDQDGRMQGIRAEIPQAEVARYSTELKSMTGGEGVFSLEFSRYEVVPAQIQQEIVERFRRQREESS